MLCYALQCYATDHTASFNHCSFTTGCWVILCHPVQRNVVTQCHQLFHDLLSYSPPMLGQRWCRHQFFLLFSISSALGCCQPYTGEPMIVSGVSGGLAGVQKLVSRHQRAKQPIVHLGPAFKLHHDSSSTESKPPAPPICSSLSAAYKLSCLNRPVGNCFDKDNMRLNKSTCLKYFSQIFVTQSTGFYSVPWLDGIVGFRFTIPRPSSAPHCVHRPFPWSQYGHFPPTPTFPSFGASSSRAEQSLQIQHFQYNLRKVRRQP